MWGSRKRTSGWAGEWGEGMGKEGQQKELHMKNSLMKPTTLNFNLKQFKIAKS